MHTKTLLGITLAVLLGVLGYAYVTDTPTGTPAPVATTPTPTGTTPSPTPTPSGYTLAQVAAHNSAASCWSAINGKVYNLTNWINQHPGGPQVILSLCGHDGSAAFDAQHGGQRRPANELAGFEIGTLL